MSEKEAKRLGNDDQSCVIFFREKNSIKTNCNSKKKLPKNNHGGLAQLFIN